MTTPTAPTVTISTATVEDAPILLDLINEAYTVEFGSEGVAFKNGPRYDSVEEVLPMVTSGGMLVAKDETGTIVGCVSYEIVVDSADADSGATSLYFGPLAVSPRHQGKGIFKTIFDHLQGLAMSHSCKYLTLTVVNHRSDLIPMYTRKFGFEAYGEEPFPSPKKLTRPAHMIKMRRLL